MIRWFLLKLKIFRIRKVNEFEVNTEIEQRQLVSQLFKGDFYCIPFFFSYYLTGFSKIKTTTLNYLSRSWRSEKNWISTEVSKSVWKSICFAPEVFTRNHGRSIIKWFIYASSIYSEQCKSLWELNSSEKIEGANTLIRVESILRIKESHWVATAHRHNLSKIKPR